jgi:hypothetical protein
MLPQCSIIRPTSPETFGAVAAVQGLVADGLFIGQSQPFFDMIGDLASKADSAGRLG